MKILLVEDDKDLCTAVCLQLEKHGYQTDTCHDGADGLYYALNHPYDLMIFDRMLPQMDGLTLLQALRRRQVMTPVIITTALDGLHDRIDGLDAGADDYLVKPFAIEELLARIRAVTRRPANLKKDTQLQLSDLKLDTMEHQLTCKDITVPLSRREYALLEYLMRNEGQTLSRSMILSYIWGSDSEVEDGNLDNYIYFLRRRLKSVASSVQIKTVHGVGYRLEVL